jgi:peroxiredoxin
MALLESLDIPLGTAMPAFQLSDPFGKTHTSAKLSGPKGLLVAFTCNHCPYAIAIWPRLIALAQQAATLGVNTVGINPNIHPDYPADGPEEMKKKIAEWRIGFPYLIDATQDVARAFKAQCTPDLYLFTAEGKLVYHGELDDNWKDESKVTKHELAEAIANLAHGKAVASEQKHSIGCSIKWKS